MDPSPAPVQLASSISPDRIERFIDLLLLWNRRINLVAKASEPEVRSRHIADSLQMLPLLPPGEGPVADLGSGAGFPGLMIAMATGRPVHLFEADRRKAAFLMECAAALELRNVVVHATRVEGAHLRSMAAVTARAFAPLPKLLSHASTMLSADGVALFLKGKDVRSELEAAQQQWQFRCELIPSLTDKHGSILRIGDIHSIKTCK